MKTSAAGLSNSDVENKKIGRTGEKKVSIDLNFQPIVRFSRNKKAIRKLTVLPFYTLDDFFIRNTKNQIYLLTLQSPIEINKKSIPKCTDSFLKSSVGKTFRQNDSKKRKNAEKRKKIHRQKRLLEIGFRHMHRPIYSKFIKNNF